MELAAIVWDYDGTLVDSTNKNMAVTLEILKNFIPDISRNLPQALSSAAEYKQANHLYKNWREMYQNCYHLSASQVDAAGKLWSPYQLKNQLSAEMYNGLPDIIRSLPNIKHGICSQNCAANIGRTLRAYGIAEHFQAVVGYEEVSFGEQKPDPAGFLKCLDLLNVSLQNTTILCIGDHQEDVTFGKNAQASIRNRGYQVEVKCIAVDYSGSRPLDWVLQPDFVASSVPELKKMIDSFL